MIFDFSERESTEKSIEIAYHAELKGIYPLVNVYITMEDHHLCSWVNLRTKSQFSSSQTVTVITRGYIPENNPIIIPLSSL